MKKVFVLTTILILIILSAGFGLWQYYTWHISTPITVDGREQDFTIEEGVTPDLVAEQLKERGIIRSSEVFSLYLKLNPNLAEGIQAGEYQVSSGNSVQELVSMFQNGATLIRLTFIEGWRREQMAIYLENAIGDSFAQEFLSLTEEHEGFLFPDTYLIGTDVTPQELINLMVETYRLKVGDEIDSKLLETGLTEEELIIFASIVEREIARPDDRAVVAGILIKRWMNAWLVGADATVQYAWADQQCTSLQEDCEWWPQMITAQMLDVDSVYNTRKYVGLPPGPIASPGEDAIMSVLNAQSSPYWYYLSDSEGNTHYAETIEGHNNNIARYL